jgi:hypothetical protein
MRVRRLQPTFDAATRTEPEESMDETYRMLGREHEADLEREAHKRRLAADAGPRRAVRDKRRSERRTLLAFFRVKEA